MLNVVTLALSAAVDGNSTAVNFGPSASAAPASRIMPGETVGVLFLASDAFDGTVEIEIAEDGSTYASAPEFDSGGTPGAAVDLTTGKSIIYEMKAAEFMRLVVASRSAGSVSAFILNGS